MIRAWFNILCLGSLVGLSSAYGAEKNILTHDFFGGFFQLEVGNQGTVSLQGPNSTLFSERLPKTAMKYPLKSVEVATFRDADRKDGLGIHFATFEITDKNGDEFYYTFFGRYKKGDGKWLLAGKGLKNSWVILRQLWSPKSEYEFLPSDLDPTGTLIALMIEPNASRDYWGTTIAIMDTKNLEISFQSPSIYVSCDNRQSWYLSGKFLSASDANKRYGFDGPDDMNGHVIWSCYRSKSYEIDMVNKQFILKSETNKVWP